MGSDYGVSRDDVEEREEESSWVNIVQPQIHFHTTCIVYIVSCTVQHCTAVLYGHLNYKHCLLDKQIRKNNLNSSKFAKLNSNKSMIESQAC